MQVQPKERRLKMLNNSGVIFTDNPRGYYLKEKKMQGITGVIKKHLFPDLYKDVSDYILKQAAEKGKQIHADLFEFDMFGVLDSEIKRKYSFLLEQENLKIIDNEYLVTDFKNFASAIDKVAIKDDEIILIDVKNTAKLNERYLSWQLSILKYLFKKVNPNLHVAGLYVIWTREMIFKKVKEISEKEVVNLLDCEINGKTYEVPKEILTAQDKEALVLIKKVTELATQIKNLEDQKKQFNAEIENLFENLNVISWETDSFLIKKTADYDRETFDSKKFKEQHPDLFENFKKSTKVKGSVKIKLK